MTRRRVAPIALLVLAAGFLPAGCQSGSAPAPQSDAAAVAGFLKEQGLEGRIVLLQFGLAECELSDAGLAKMMRLGREGVLPQLAFIRVEGSPDAVAVDVYFAARKPGFTVHRDPQALVGRAFDATAYPTYILADKFGRVRYRGPYPEDDDLIKWVDALADEKADAGPQAPLFGVTPLVVQKLLDETRLPNLAGETKALREYLGPGGLLAVFVDTRCPFSGEAIADMPKVAAALAKHQAPSVLVNIGDKPDAVREFYTNKNLNLPVVHDDTVATQKAWQVYAVPTVVLFDAKGEVAYRGKAVWADLAKAAENTLKLPSGSIKFDVKGTEFG